MKNTFTLGFIDTETTGLDPGKCQVIEVAVSAVRWDMDKTRYELVSEYTGLQESAKPLPDIITQITGLTDRDLKGQSIDWEAVEIILTGCDFLVAHNASFDKGFMLKYSDAAGIKPWLCTLRHINWHKENIHKRKLTTLIRHFGVTVNRSHRALDDVKALMNIVLTPRSKAGPFINQAIQKFM